MPRNPSAPDARLCTIAESPAPTPYPAAISATAAARSCELVSSAAMTSASALVALSNGRPKAKMTTNHQYPGLAAATTVSARPAIVTTRITRRRPRRSAIPMRGRLPSDARRMTASPIPRLVPDNPTLSAMDDPAATWPSCVDTSPRAATTPNCPKPDARAMMATATTARSDQRCSRSVTGCIGRAGCPDGRGPVRRRLGHGSGAWVGPLPARMAERRRSSQTSRSDVCEKSTYHSPTA